MTFQGTWDPPIPVQSTWDPSNPTSMGLLPCEWKACIDAPAATSGSQLTDLLYNGTKYR